MAKSFRAAKPLRIEDAVRSKMVRQKNARTGFNISEMFEKISRGRAGVAADAKAIREMLPDVKLVENLIIDSVLAPNDLTNIRPRFYMENARFSDSPVVSKINALVEDHFVNHHKIVDNLKSNLMDILFNYGSHTKVILPENTIDDIINGRTRPGMENFQAERARASRMLRDNIGILGQGLDFQKEIRSQRRGEIGLEHLGDDRPTSRAVTPTMNALGYAVHDNPNCLKMPKIRAALNSFNVQDKLRSVGIENFSMSTGYRTPFNGVGGDGVSSTSGITTLSPSEQREISKMYRDTGNAVQDIVTAKPQSQLDRESVGHPSILCPTADAVIVAHTPDSMGTIIGAFIILQEDGNPISLPTEITRYNQMANLYTNNGQSFSDGDSDASATIRQSYTKMYGVKSNNTERDISNLKAMFSQIVVDDLNQRFVEGIYGRTVELAAHEHIFKAMLARHLSNMSTRLLWIPESLLCYMAVAWNDDGTGRALTEDVKIVASYRSMVMMANVMGAINNSINHTKLRIKLDEVDQEPHETIREALEEHIMTKATMPVNTISFLEQQTYLQSANITVEVEGNDQTMQTEVTTEDWNRNMTQPDGDLMEDLRKMHLSAYGVTIEQLDQLLSSDTATAVKAATANFTKSVQNIRHATNRNYTDFIRKYTANSTPLRDDIAEIIKEHQTELPAELAEIAKDENGDIDYIVNEIIRSLMFELPDAEFHITDAHMDAFEKHMEMAEKLAEVHFNPDVLSAAGLGDQGSEQADLLKSAFLATMARDFMRSNGITKFDSLIYGGIGETTLDRAHMAYLENISIILRNMAGPARELRAKNEKLLTEEQSDIDEVGGTSVGGSDMSFGGDDSGGGGGDDMDFGGDDEGFTIEEESEETTETTETTDDDAGGDMDLDF